MSVSYFARHILYQKGSKCRITSKVQCIFFRDWWSCPNRFFSSQVSDEKNSEAFRKFMPFQDVINYRRYEAKRSILVQVQSAQSYAELHGYCSSLGNICQMLHYTTGVEPMHFIIVEFLNEDDVQNVLSACSHVDDAHVVPVRSQFLWFRATNRKLAKLKQIPIPKLSIENGTQLIKGRDLMENLHNSSDVSEQMRTLYNATKLNDVGSRLRFLAARQVELAICGMFPVATAIPFGSSVNGCGKMGCDLDLVLRLSDDTKSNSEHRLMFHSKASTASERSISQRHMEAIGDLIQLFLPGCTQVRRILQARVPIIKYYQQLTDIECDLSMFNMSGVYMSELLYMYGALDNRVQPLIFTVRKWAHEVGLTNSFPGRWITNFSLTLMVIAFLQNPLNMPPVLPSFNTLIKMAGTEDKYITEDGINCTFLRDLNNFKFKTKNEENLSSLLQQFFEYYSLFDFSSKGISLNEGVPVTKPEHGTLYIVNPLERGLNVSKNVSIEELEKFKMEIRNAAWLLEEEENRASKWGILSIFDRKTKIATLAPSKQAGSRLMDVTKLFEESEMDANDQRNVNKTRGESVEIKVKQFEENTNRFPKMRRRKLRR